MCCGYINDKRIKLTLTEKEDFQRVIQFYLLKLPILKRTGYGIRTKPWINQGGLQSRYSMKKRIIIQKKSANKLMMLYPGLGYLMVRKNGVVDFKFRSKDPLNIYNK